MVLAALPLVAAAMVLAPQSMSDRARVWAAPVFRPLQSVTAEWALDLNQPFEPSRPTAAAPVPDDLVRRLRVLENALAEATARLADYDRRVRDLAHIRDALDGLPCRLVPARVMAPEVAGGRTSAMLSKGFSDGVRPGGAVVRARLDRGAREAIETGEPVLTAAGLVGVVDQVGPLTSGFRLLSHPDTRLLVQLVLRRDGRWQPGPDGLSAEGAGDGRTMVIEHVPRAADVAVGDFVVTSPSPESALPPFLIVGRVARSDPHPTNLLFLTLVVELQVPSDAAREVYVLSRDAGAER
ncbi:MAG: rod shape-determining protein MreC [Planctomycetes bacterium]|nr:rod shape-determining protein MreC [Planctomycetota bacterium]